MSPSLAVLDLGLKNAMLMILTAFLKRLGTFRGASSSCPENLALVGADGSLALVSENKRTFKVRLRNENK